MIQWSNKNWLVLGFVFVLFGLGLFIISSRDGQPEQTAVFAIDKERLTPPEELLTASRPFILDDFEGDGDHDTLTISEPQLWVVDRQGDYTHDVQDLNEVEVKVEWPQTMRWREPHLVRLTLTMPAYDGVPDGAPLPEFVPENVYETGDGLVNSSWTAVAETTQGSTARKPVSDSKQSPRELVWEWEVVPEKLQTDTIHFYVEKAWQLADNRQAAPLTRTIWSGSAETWVISPESDVDATKFFRNLSLALGIVLIMQGVLKLRTNR